MCIRDRYIREDIDSFENVRIKEGDTCGENEKTYLRMVEEDMIESKERCKTGFINGRHDVREIYAMVSSAENLSSIKRMIRTNKKKEKCQKRHEEMMKCIRLWPVLVRKGGYE